MYLGMIIVIALISMKGECEIVRMDVPLKNLFLVGGSLFVKKFTIGIGEGLIKAAYVREKETSNPYEGVKLGLVMDEEVEQFLTIGDCEKRASLFKQVHELHWIDSVKGEKNFKIKQTVRPHLWYVYLFNCQAQEDNTYNLNLSLELRNNESHFSHHEIPLLYPFLFLICSFILTYYHYLITLYIGELPNMLLSSSLLILWAAYILKIAQLAFMWLFGIQVLLLNTLYVVMLALVEAVVFALLFATCWGYIIIHQKGKIYYVLVGVLWLVVHIYSYADTEDTEMDYHEHDGIEGSIHILFRMLGWLGASIGCLWVLGNYIGKVRLLIGKVWVMVSIYLLCSPVAIIFTEILLPPYHHTHVVLVCEEVCRLLCVFMVVYQNNYYHSQYSKLKQKCTFLPLYQI